VNETHASPVFENPFCTRRVRPGAMPFLFPPGDSAESLVERLRQHGWWGEILGPHGSGKSALLASLLPAIERAGMRTVLIELHDAERRLPLALSGDPRVVPPVVLVVDGYEQLSRWNRLGLKRFCRRRRLGLLVTAHESVGFPELYRTTATLGQAQRIVAVLLGSRQPPFTSEELAACFARRRGDLRETLFELYDLYEQRQPLSGQNVN